MYGEFNQYDTTIGGSIMDMSKILQWMDLAKKYQTTDFWNEIFEQPSFNEFLNNNMNSDQMEESPLDLSKRKKFPPTDIYITDEEVLLIADLAGYVKEDIHLSVSGTKLLIKGSDAKVFIGEPIQQERHHGEFQRIIQLPEPTFPNQIRAKFNNGLLIIAYKRQFAKEEDVPIE